MNDLSTKEIGPIKNENEEKIQQLTKILTTTNDEVILRQAANDFARIGEPAENDLILLVKSSNQVASSYAAYALSKIHADTNTSKIIATLVEFFPKLVITVKLSGDIGGNKEECESRLFIDELNLLSILTSEYGEEFFTIDNKIDDVFYYTNNIYGLKSVKIDRIITYTYYAGALALHEITGEKIGNDQNKWKQWWVKNKSK
jgi:hypothetical protein